MKQQNSIEINSKKRLRNDRLFKASIIALALIASSPLVFIVSQLIIKGYSQLNISFFTETAPDTFEAMLAIQSGEKIPGGILNGITGTFYLVSVAFALAFPFGIIIGVFLYENPKKRYAGFIRDITDILQGMPSIVLGLIAYIWVVKGITSGYSVLAGSSALAMMMLPLIIRSTEETMKMIPNSVREAGFALGVPYHKVILKLLIPYGLKGIIAGVLLSISRVMGETAPLMLTTLGSMTVNWDITKPTSAIPLLIWEFYNDPNMINLIWSSSLVLMIFVLILNILAKNIISKRS